MGYEKAKLIIADLDGTLNVSKSPMDSEMAGIIREILDYKDFAVISGGSYAQFQKQFLPSLSSAKRIDHLYLFPTCATSMYVMKDNEWRKVYGERIPDDSKRKILEAFERALHEYGFKKPEKLYGELIEDRETQITFSAYGQLAPIELKSTWDPNGSKRLKIVSYLAKYLPEGFEAKVGGTTSIDVTKKGVDKAYGIRKIEENLGYKKSEMLFIGDALFEGGNDYPVKATGVECIAVNGPEETKRILMSIIEGSEKLV